jgi:hypothetical protein
MGSRDSWIDPDEVSGLAGEIFPHAKRQRRDTEKYVPVSLVDDDDVADLGRGLADGSEDAGTAQRIGERLRAIRKRADRSGLLIGSDVKTASELDSETHAEFGEPPAFVLPAGRLVEQVAALASWLREAEGFDQVFLLDELGDELVPGEVPAGLRSGAVRLAQSWERSQAWLDDDGLAAEVPVAGAALGGGKVLSVIGARCTGGFYCAAMVGDRLVPVQLAARVREALFLVFS